MKRAENKAVLVTGAAGGLGRATALRLADEGARLAITDCHEMGLEETARLLRVKGAEVVAVAGDLRKSDTVDRWVAAAVAAFGTVNGLCNVAGVLRGGPIDHQTADDFHELMTVNCLAQFLAIQRVAPEMRKAGGGSIVNVASIGALVALPMMSLYCASKSAVLGLTRAIALELGPEIRCNAICPGGIDTQMARNFLANFDNQDEMIAKLVGRQILKRFAEPREIAEAIVFLVSDESSFMTGSVVPVEAGHSAW